MLWDPRRRELRESEPAPLYIVLVNVAALVGLLILVSFVVTTIGVGTYMLWIWLLFG